MIEAFKTALNLISAPEEVDPQDASDEMNADLFHEDRVFSKEG